MFTILNTILAELSYFKNNIYIVVKTRKLCKNKVLNIVNEELSKQLNLHSLIESSVIRLTGLPCTANKLECFTVVNKYKASN